MFGSTWVARTLKPLGAVALATPKESMAGMQPAEVVFAVQYVIGGGQPEGPRAGRVLPLHGQEPSQAPLEHPRPDPWRPPPAPAGSRSPQSASALPARVSNRALEALALSRGPGMTGT